MQKASNDIIDIVNEIIANINLVNTVVFCGAGISRDSGLPLANELIPSVLKKLAIPEIDIQLILNADNSPKIPFEAFIEGLGSNSNLDNIYNIYNLGEPNTNHLLLAKLIKHQKLKTILTTNFDRLIEKALYLEPKMMVEGKDYDVIYKDKEFEKIDWTKERIRIIKIHGSIDDKEAMSVMLKHVASHFLSEARKKIIEHIFSAGDHTNVLVLGYSASDVFDITPQIKSIINDRKKVYYIQHSQESKSEDIREQRDKNPFNKFTKSIRLFYDTNQLIKNIWETSINNCEPYVLKTSQTNWKENVDEWIKHAIEIRTIAVKYTIPAYIFTEMGLSKTALKYYKKALQNFVDDRQEESIGRILGDMGNAFYNMGEHNESIKYSLKALEIAREYNNKMAEGMWLSNLGCAYANIGQYEISVKYTEQALMIAKECHDERSEGRCMGNLGSYYMNKGESQKAIKYLKQAIKISQQIGDKKNETLWLIHFSCYYLRIELFNEAIKYSSDALNISEEIGDIQYQGIALSNLGIAYLCLREDNKSLECFKQALKISQEIGNREQEGIRLGNLGRFYFVKGESFNTIKYTKDALEILRPLLGEDHPTIKQFEKNFLDAISKPI